VRRPLTEATIDRFAGGQDDAVTALEKFYGVDIFDSDLAISAPITVGVVVAVLALRAPHPHAHPLAPLLTPALRAMPAAYLSAPFFGWHEPLPCWPTSILTREDPWIASSGCWPGGRGYLDGSVPAAATVPATELGRTN
jgi:hypothetical protein